MFLDASANVAILAGESDAAFLSTKLPEAAVRITSPIAVFEAVLALAREGGGDIAKARSVVTRFLQAAMIEVVDVGPAECEAALDAYDRYGKGRHPARLNMGDCFAYAYACARTHGAPLLFKSDDFTKTDVAIA